ncbi:hypothetical protein FRB90_005955 [Tulasnella sp. 427]|nr:hypothetical protein FRB90_005955 [Tulasnella sp. 427]
MSAPQDHGNFNNNNHGANSWRNLTRFASIVSVWGSVAGDDDDAPAQDVQATGPANQAGPVNQGAAGTGQNQAIEPANVAAQPAASPVTPPWSPVLPFGPHQNYHNAHQVPDAPTLAAQSEAGSSADGGDMYEPPFSPLLPRLTSPVASTNIKRENSPENKASIPTNNIAGPSSSRGERSGAATPAQPPRRSLRETAQRAKEAIKAILTTKSRRGKGATTATNSGRPSGSTVPASPTPAPIKQEASDSEQEQEKNFKEEEEEQYIKKEDEEEEHHVKKEEEDEQETKPKPSAKALGKRRRVDPEDEEDADDEDERSPSKRSRKVKNLKNRSTPSRFATKKEEPTSPNPFIATRKRKRGSIDEDYDAPMAGPSKRARSAKTEVKVETSSVRAASMEPLRGPSVRPPGPPVTDAPHLQPGSGVSNPPLPSFVITIPPQDGSEEPHIPPLATPAPPPAPQPLTRQNAKLILEQKARRSSPRSPK